MSFTNFGNKKMYVLCTRIPEWTGKVCTMHGHEMGYSLIASKYPHLLYNHFIHLDNNR